jgi:hypothetical protein
MSTLSDANSPPGNGLAQLFRVLEGQAGDRGVRELLEGVRAALSARLEEQAAFREQQALLERLREENARLTVERDQYLRSLYALLPKSDITFTEEELRDLEQNGVTLDEFLKELEAFGGDQHG